MELDSEFAYGVLVVIIIVKIARILLLGIRMMELNLIQKLKMKYSFDTKAKNEIFDELSKDYISGITLTGGDPLNENNLESVLNLVNEIRLSYPEKTIWLYTGYTWGQIMYPVVTGDFNPERDKLVKMRQDIVRQCDVLVDGRYEEDKRDVTYHWAGSTNQREGNVMFS